jgi:Ca-activated chloride channel family protein
VNSTELNQAFAPKSAETGQPIELAMQRLWLVGRVLGVGARLLVKHTFRSGEKKPLEVIYGFGLPRDAALRSFRITGKGFSVTSDLKPIEKVKETYEEALAEGHLAAMAAQYGDGMVNLTVGNIRPGEEVTVNLEIVAGVETRDDGIRFRFPFTLAPAYHAKAKAAEVAPGVGEIELPSEEFGDLVLPQFVLDASALHEVGFDLSVSMGHPIVEAGSPSHAVRVVGQGIGRSRVSLATAKDLPNRDLVLDIRTGESLAGVLAGTGSDGKGHFGAVIPSSVFKAVAKEGDKEGGIEELRRVVFVVDRSGSMGGAPIEQARKAVSACLGALGADDSFGIVAFDDSVEVFSAGLVEASTDNRELARKFLDGIDARGGTELAGGIRAAAEMLKKRSEGKGDGGGGGGGDVLVATDGQVMGTESILGVARESGIRLHCLGIGSASQDRFLTLLARETGGVSRFLTPRERVDLGAVELFASIGRPLGSGLEAKIEGFGDGARIAPDLAGFVFGGTPIVVFGETDGAGEGRLALEWEAGKKKKTLAVPLRIGAGGDGETLRLLQGVRLITDMESRLESRYAAGEAGGVKGREADRIKKRLVALSTAYGLASREMGLVAVVVRAGDKPGDIPITKVVPVGLAQDVEMGAYFGAQAGTLDLSKCIMAAPGLGGVGFSARKAKALFSLGSTVFARRSQSASMVHKEVDADLEVDADAADQLSLLNLASSIEADGGMPGKTEEERVLATILALLRFVDGGHTASHGAFRAHVVRMMDYLAKSKIQTDLVSKIVDRARTGRALAGDWQKAKPEPALWAKLARALKPGT